jgi:peptidoglycan hydrolase CwlO-like protein
MIQKSDEDRDSLQKLIFDLAAINFNKKHDRSQLNGSDGEFQQVLNSVKQLTAEIASLSEGFHDLLNSQITYYQKCNSLQDSFQQLTAEIASLS